MKGIRAYTNARNQKYKNCGYKAHRYIPAVTADSCSLETDRETRAIPLNDKTAKKKKKKKKKKKNKLAYVSAQV